MTREHPKQEGYTIIDDDAGVKRSPHGCIFIDEEHEHRTDHAATGCVMIFKRMVWFSVVYTLRYHGVNELNDYSTGSCCYSCSRS